MLFVAQLSTVLASAVTYGWCFPPNPHPWLSWIALAPFLMVIRKGTAGRALFLAWVWTVAMAYTVNDWFPRAVSGYFHQPAAVGIALFLGVSTFTAALQYMAFAAVYRQLVTLHPTAVPFLAASAWVAADMARLLLFGGDPWALLGYSQVGVLPIMQIADATGVHGITFVVAAVNAALAELWCAARDRRRLVPAAIGMSSSVFAALSVLVYGAVRLHAGVPTADAGQPVGIVQAHLPLGSQWKREFYGRNLSTYLRLTNELLRASAPPLVVWPENAMTFFLSDEPSYRRSIASVLEPFGAQLLAGGPELRPGPPSQYLNAAFLISPQGDIVGRYDKRLLLPFAEYFPLGQFDFLRRAFARFRAFVPGGRTPLLQTAVGPLGVVICNEGFFPEPAAERVRDGAIALVNLANDSWLADPKYSEPAFDMVTLRAVEQHRWIIRSSTAGPSALIDPFGRVTQRSDLLSAATMFGVIEPSHTVTLYNRIGDAFAWGCVVLTMLAWLAAWRRSSRGAGRAEARSDGRHSRSAAA
jgi:apolipoprotein N-acyltransferase